MAQLTPGQLGNQLFSLFFSATGRIGRLMFWIGNIPLMLASMALFEWSLARVAGDGASSADFLKTPAGLWAHGSAALLVFVVFLWPAWVVTVKRLHDLDRPTWVALLFTAPEGLAALAELAGLPVTGGQRNLIGYGLDALNLGVFLWYVFELGSLPGTSGPNTFGQEPKFPGV